MSAVNASAPTPTKAIVLVSGGLDSATVLAKALHEGRACYALSIDYGQRHRVELQAAERLAHSMGVREHREMRVDLAGIGGSALTDMNLRVPEQATSGIPITYVPARNTLFLSLCLAWAEVVGASEIHLGVNAVDYSGYPDCRPEYINAFKTMATLATKAGVEGAPLEFCTPLIALSKVEIIRLGLRLGVDYSKTVSCYQADDEGRACGKCDSCRIRAQGFYDAGVVDPTRYR